MRQRFVLIIIVSLCLVALAPPSAFSQGAGAPQVAISQIDASHYPDMTLYLAVNDANGLPISGLAPDAFQILQDGKRLPKFDVRPVARTTPLTMVLALDTSNSMRGEPLEALKAAATRFIDGLGPNDRLALYTFSGDVALAQDYTADRDLLKARVAGLSTSEATALYEAVYQAAGHLDAAAPGRKAVVVLTDGRNEPYNRTPRTLDEAIGQAKTVGVPVYTLGFGGVQDEPLTRLTQETQGQYLRGPSAAEIGALFARLAGQLQNQYVATFTVDNPASGDHSLEVEVETAAGTARTAQPRVYTVVYVQPTAVPTVAPTAVPTSAPTLAPTPAPTLAPTVVPLPISPPTEGLPWWLLPLLAVGLVAAGGGAYYFVHQNRAPRVCPTCGRTMDPKWKTCLFCEQGIGLTTHEPETMHGIPVPGGGPAETSLMSQMSEPAPTVMLKAERTPPALAWLIVETGVHAGHEFRLNAQETTIGRAAQNDIVLDDTAVSRNQAKVRREGNAWVIYDMGATNPTEVSGQAITRHTLRDGERVTVGETVFVFKEVG